MKLLVLPILLSACAPEYSPWQSDVDSDQLTRKNIERLADTGLLEPFKIAIIGDPQVVHGSFRNAKDIINKHNVDFTVIAGDLTDRGLKREWEWVGDIVKDFKKPVFTVVGNHDGLNKGNDIYKRMFGSLNYAFTYKQHRFIMWNNNKYEWGAPDFDWLEKQASSLNSIIISHQPPYSGTLNAEEEERWRRIRQNGNVVSNIHGHLHHYNLVIENGIPIYTVERVEDSKWGMMEVDEGVVTFSNCQRRCEVISE